jgi:hypothetical protein
MRRDFETLRKQMQVGAITHAMSKMEQKGLPQIVNGLLGDRTFCYSSRMLQPIEYREDDLGQMPAEWGLYSELCFNGHEDTGIAGKVYVDAPYDGSAFVVDITSRHGSFKKRFLLQSYGNEVYHYMWNSIYSGLSQAMVEKKRTVVELQ